MPSLKRLWLYAVVFCLALAALLAAGCGGGEVPPEQLTPAPPTTDLRLVAKDIKFDTHALAVPATSEVSVTLVNQGNLRHNLSVYRDKSAKEKLFVGEIVDAKKTGAGRFKSPAPGQYYFRCDLHPSMNGTLYVQ